jgi:hypothetical protein
MTHCKTPAAPVKLCWNTGNIPKKNKEKKTIKSYTMLHAHYGNIHDIRRKLLNVKFKLKSTENRNKSEIFFIGVHLQ